MPLYSFANPALRTLAATIGTAYGIQALCGAVAVPMQTEKYYDLSGSLTFISCTAVSLYFPFLRNRFILGQNVTAPSLTSFHPRQLIMSGLTCLWAGRLGTFLYQRIQKSGSDTRFDKIKDKPATFFGVWMMQAAWVTLTALPVFAVNAIPTHMQPKLGIRDGLGLAIWISAFLFEVIADRQKSAWREAKSNKSHDEKFISSGLWSLSRHPNYVGEVTMWTSLFFISTSALSNAPLLYPGWSIGVAALSPVLEYLLITKISGLPPLERKADKQFKDDSNYQAYKKQTPVFWPKLL